MPGRAEAHIVVAGSGVLGSVIALALAQEGARVTLADPARLGDNASGVAAGMLAPAFEAILDPAMAAHFDLLKAARDLWPDFVGRMGAADLGLRRCGAIWVDVEGAGPSLDANERALAAVGAAAERLTADQVRQRLPGLRTTSGGVRTTEDWRLAPGPALAALRAAAIGAGVAVIDQRLIGFEAGAARFADGRSVRADAVVLATGWASTDLAPELACLTPIKGHILLIPAAAQPDTPILRCADGYVVTGPKGLHIGATMEPGRDDDAIDPAAVARLWAVGTGHYPALSSATPLARTGVRAASPDGLPLVGPSARPGVFLAAGARRNGWLLAPLVASMTAAYLAGRDPGPYASLFDARRFGRV